MAKPDRRKGQAVTLVINRHEEAAAGHHGGAWKVAYADFVTAMMAFFLLMWLLNATTEEQRKGLADYFSPTNELARNHAGSGLALGGKTAFDDGGLVTDRGSVRVITGQAPVVDQEEDADAETQARPRVYRADDPASDVPAQDDTMNKTRTDAALRAASQQADAEQHEKQAFEKAAEQIRQAVQSDPNVAALAKQLVIDVTPEGLRVQIMDNEQQPMFANGSAAPNDRARLLLQKIGPALGKLTEDISVAGHTDAAPFPGAERTNWELSSDRANATRRLLIDAGLAAARIREVIGNADRDLLLPQTPLAAANRRIAITVLRRASSMPSLTQQAPAAGAAPASSSL
jgi:chemotaxis protein MotB